MKNLKKLKACLIGCGRISVRHSHLLGNKLISNIELAAVCDINLDNAIKVSEKYNVPYYSDMCEMVKSEDIDLAVVLTESGFHSEHVFKIAKYVSNIIVEKPIALNVKDAIEMQNECERYNSRLFVVKQNRFNLPVQKLQEAKENGRFKKLFLGTVRVRWTRKQSYYEQDNWRGKWSMDGGVLANQAIHHIDMLQWLMGEVESVFAYAIQASAKIEAEDTAIATLKFKDGSLGLVEATTATRPRDLEGSISILGTGGTVVIEGFAVNQMKTWEFTDEIPEDKNVINNFSVNPPNVYGYGHKEFYESVVKSIIENTDHPLTSFEAIKSLKVVNAIYESIHTGKEVNLNKSDFNNRLGSKD